MLPRKTAWILFAAMALVLGALLVWPLVSVIGGGFWVDGRLSFHYVKGVFQNAVYGEGLLLSLIHI